MHSKVFVIPILIFFLFQNYAIILFVKASLISLEKNSFISKVFNHCTIMKYENHKCNAIDTTKKIKILLCIVLYNKFNCIVLKILTWLNSSIQEL